MFAHPRKMSLSAPVCRENLTAIISQTDFRRRIRLKRSDSIERNRLDRQTYLGPPNDPVVSTIRRVINEHKLGVHSGGSPSKKKKLIFCSPKQRATCSARFSAVQSDVLRTVFAIRSREPLPRRTAINTFSTDSRVLTQRAVNYAIHITLYYIIILLFGICIHVMRGDSVRPVGRRVWLLENDNTIIVGTQRLTIAERVQQQQQQ